MNGSTTDLIRRHLVGLKMPRALEALQTTLSRIEQVSSLNHAFGHPRPPN